ALSLNGFRAVSHHPYARNASTQSTRRLCFAVMLTASSVQPLASALFGDLFPSGERSVALSVTIAGRRRRGATKTQPHVGHSRRAMRAHYLGTSPSGRDRAPLYGFGRDLPH